LSALDVSCLFIRGYPFIRGYTAPHERDRRLDEAGIPELGRPAATLLVSGGRPPVAVTNGRAVFRVDAIDDHEVVVVA